MIRWFGQEIIRILLLQQNWPMNIYPGMGMSLKKNGGINDCGYGIYHIN